MKPSLIALLAVLPVVTFAADLDFEEEFADPATREAALADLVPGTRDGFFHHALHHQLRGETDAFERVVSDWRAAADREQRPVSADGLDTLLTRELLLRHDAEPEQSRAGLIDTLDLEFDDARPDAREVEKLADTLDPALISPEAFEKAAGSNNHNRPWRHHATDRLLADLDHLGSFSEARLRHSLRTLTRADHPRAVDLVARGLQLDPPVAFADSAPHPRLTLDQLDALRQRLPDLDADLDFVRARLKKLRRHSDADFARDPALHAAHLATLRKATADLPPALASLKAHVLFHHLRLQRETAGPKLDDFLAYLAIPRRSHGLLIEAEEKDIPALSLDRDFAALTGCPPVKNDTPLIRELLTRFLADTDSADRFARLIEKDALTRLHARARLLAGADPDRWGKLLDPSEFAALRDETRIDFAPGRPVLLDADAPVALALDLKHTPEVLVRIHALDLPAILAREGREPTASMDLAGLVPHHTRTLRYDQPPLVRHRETIDLPELEGPGAWIVEFVAEGRACRALIRKGRLVPYLTRTATGQTLRVFDETGAPVPDAALTLGPDTFPAGDDGRIRIPNAELAKAGEALLARGTLATLVEIDGRDDALGIHANFHLDREQLRSDAEARVRIDLALTNHRRPLPLDLIENARLTFSATLASGITTDHVIADDLELAPTFTVPFQVPADTVALDLKLSATVVPRDRADPVKLEATDRFAFNSLLEGGFTHGHFTLTPDGHRLEVRGRNGEPLPDRAIGLGFLHDDYNPSISIDLRLRTDADGRIHLGRLDGIRRVTASHDGDALAVLGGSQFRPVSRIPDDIRVAFGEEIVLPLEAPLDRVRYSLLRHDLSGKPLANHFENLAAKDDRLTITDLPPGRYELKTPSDLASIEVIDGTPTDDRFITPGKIAPRLPAAVPVALSSAIAENQIRIRLANSTPDTRVHLIGTRFLHGNGAYRNLRPHTPPHAPVVTPGFTASGYLTDRVLDEETRYILERRATKTFPGAMLPRAGLLAHRWSEEDLDSDLLPPLDGSEGKESGGSGGFDSGSGGVDPFASGGGSGSSATPDYLDYLARSSELRYDLRPDADGLVAVPLAAFDGCQLVQIVVTAADTLHREILPLPENPIPLRDRRLARPLDPDKHHLGTRRAAVLMQGAEASIENMLDADWRAFTTLEEAHAFLYGATGSERLRDMAGLLDWPDFDEQSKLAFWSDHACHELHLFLSRRDPGFFEKHVKPLLAEKREPTFIDDLLLDRDLKPYLRPYAWKKLNAAEKALLARALPDARERIAAELEHRWELEEPNPEQQTRLFTQTLRGTDLATEDSLGLARSGMDAPGMSSTHLGATYPLQKLRDIVVPIIDFEDTSLREAIDFLRAQSVELDTREAHPEKRGVNFAVQNAASARIKELNLRNVPLTKALDYICEATGMRWSMDDFAVVIRPASDASDVLSTRTFDVPPDFLARISSDGNEADDFSDPFAQTDNNPGSALLLPRMSIVEALKANGITFPEGAIVTFDSANSRLIVRNTANNQHLVETLVSHAENASSPDAPADRPGFPVTPATPDDEFRDLADLLPQFDEEEGDYDSPQLPNSVGYSARASWSADRGQPRLWLESNYDHHRGTDTGESLIPLNAFWLDLAKWDGQGPFLSPHFNACTSSPNESLMGLALLDLPFTAERPEVRVDGPSLKVKAREPMLLYYKDTRETDEVAPDSPVLVRQTFHRLDDRFRSENGRKVENTITGGFRTGVAYGSSLVVTNPTGAGRRIEVLAQIPAGAIALAGREATLSETRELEPYGVLTFDLAFYFPAPGTFAGYPLQVAEDDTILATAARRVLDVTDADPAEDRASWKVVARDGPDAEVLARLAGANLHAIDLDLIAWRMRDRGFYQKAIATLRDRLALPPTLARYAFLHGDADTMRAWLETSDLVTELGHFLESPLLDIRPVEHLGWRSLEFDPLVNPRAHRLGDNPRLTQPEALAHYRAFLRQLAWKPALDADDQLHLTWFLFLQDRIGEALDRFAKIDRDQLATTLAYDYLHCLVHFHQARPVEAAAIAQRHTALPPGPWAERFTAVRDQAAEIAALRETREIDDSDQADPAPRLDLALASDGSLRLTHRHLAEAELSLYQIDLEMLFSRNPFLEDAGELPGTQPNLVRRVRLGGDATTVELPAAFRRGNVLVAADAGGTKALRILDSRALEVTCRRADPVLRVRDAATRAPLPGAYVKVYVERDGGAEFLKDGYTDLRGQFDYRTLTDGSRPPAGRLALFISHPEKGSRTLTLE
jgi:hypothetical protein